MDGISAPGRIVSCFQCEFFLTKCYILEIIEHPRGARDPCYKATAKHVISCNYNHNMKCI